MRFVLEIKRGKWSPTRTVDELIKTWDKHRPQIIVVENNASQEAIIQWASERGGIDMPIVPFTTGKQKADPILGLPSMEVEFANGAWCCPMQGVDTTDSENPLNVWKKELDDHPLGTAADTVMASWFAREGARFLMGGKTDDGQVVTGEDVGVEQVQIGDHY